MSKTKIIQFICNRRSTFLFHILQAVASSCFGRQSRLRRERYRAPGVEQRQRGQRAQEGDHRSCRMILDSVK
jgi:hypothetical protein